jgi:hypothetical protein
MTKDDDPYANIKQHRLTPEMERQIAEAHVRRRDGSGRAYGSSRVKPANPSHFVQVPGFWVDRLKKPRCAATYPLALQLLRLAWRTGGSSIELSNERLTVQGVNRWGKWRALAELEKLGLVIVERRRRKSPCVGLVLSARDGQN